MGAGPGWMMMMSGVGVRLLCSKPPQSTAMGSQPGWMMRMSGVGVRLLCSKPPQSTAMGSHPRERYMGGGFSQNIIVYVVCCCSMLYVCLNERWMSLITRLQFVDSLDVL
jgi:hypothetical protein